MSIQDDIQKLEQELREKRELLYRYELDWSEAIREHELKYPPALVFGQFAFVNDTGVISFTLSRYDKTVVDALQLFPRRFYSGGRNHIQQRSWNDLLELIKNIPNAQLSIEESIHNRILNWKPVPDFKVYITSGNEAEDEPSKIGVTLLRNTSDSWYLTDKLRTAIYKHQFRTVYISLGEYEPLIKLLNDSEKRGKVIEYDSTWKEYKPDNTLIKVGTIAQGKLELRPFQEEGIKFVLSHGANALIGDEMGLGKSPQAILIFESLAKENEQT